jgi:hypothetical protein
MDSDLTLAATRAARIARETFGVLRAALFWREAGSDGLTCIASAGEGGAEGWVGRTLPAGVGMAGRAVAEGRPVWSPDLPADPRVPIVAWLREQMGSEGLRVVAAAPVRVGGAVRGALGILDSAGRCYQEEDLRRLGRLADETGAALERVIAPGA